MDSDFYFPDDEVKIVSNNLKNFLKFLLLKDYEQRTKRINIETIQN